MKTNNIAVPIKRMSSLCLSFEKLDLPLGASAYVNEQRERHKTARGEQDKEGRLAHIAEQAAKAAEQVERHMHNNRRGERAAFFGDIGEHDTE